MRTRIKDFDVGYDRAGSGEGVLLVMGLGTTRIGWFNQFRYLSQSYDVTAFDNRGAGETDTPPGQWTMQDLADDVLAVADAMGYERFHLAGVSMGGMISQEVSLAAPERIRSLTLVSTSAGGHEAVLASPEYMAAIMLPDPRERVRRSIELLFGSKYRAEHPEIVDAAVSLALGGGSAVSGPVFEVQPDMSAGFMSQITAIMSWSAAGGTADRLGAITTPTLVMHGGDDLLVPLPNGELLARKIPGARLREWDDAGHALLQEHADEVNEEMGSHLASASVSA
jgi:3-oxoadipate enol-lactonase